MATSEVVTFTDEQLSDMRETIDQFCRLQNDHCVTVQTADVEIAGGKVVHVRWWNGEFLVDV